jgi:hypothetical protein
MQGSFEVGVPAQISSSTNIKPSSGSLLGIFVSSASGSPTVAVYDSATTTTTAKLVDTFTPVAGSFYRLPLSFANGLYVAIGATTSITVFYA